MLHHTKSRGAEMQLQPILFIDPRENPPFCRLVCRQKPGRGCAVALGRPLPHTLNTRGPNFGTNPDAEIFPGHDSPMMYGGENRSFLEMEKERRKKKYIPMSTERQVHARV